MVPVPGRPAERTVLYRVPSGARADDVAPMELDLAGGSGSEVHEDPRLFVWRGDIWVLWTVSEPAGQDAFLNTMRMGRVDGTTVDRIITLDSPQGAAREKNWMPLVHGRRLYFAYDLGGGQLYELAEDTTLRLAHSGRIRALEGESGSSQFVPFADGWLGVSHHRVDRPFVLAWLPVAYYRHRLIHLNSDFSVRSTSRPFFFVKRAVEFCAGLVVDDRSVTFSLGIEDAEAVLMTVPRTEIDALLTDREGQTPQ